MLRINNHPSERGHAVLGDAVVKAIASRDELGTIGRKRSITTFTRLFDPSADTL
jgi:hypothetical protein